MEQVRVLNRTGIEEFKKYCDQAYENNELPPPCHLLHEKTVSEVFNENCYLEKRSFKNKKEMAEYLSEVLKAAADKRIILNAGLWSWLALYYFNEICPEYNSKRKILKSYHYVMDIPDGKLIWNRYYRHLIASPYFIYKNNPENSNVILMSSINVHGDIMEQLASRQEIITNSEILKVADILYFDKKKMVLKKGATSKDVPGSVRRFSKDIFSQLSVTYDLYSMKAEQIQELLPVSEFQIWFE